MRVVMKRTIERDLDGENLLQARIQQASASHGIRILDTFWDVPQRLVSSIFLNKTILIRLQKTNSFFSFCIIFRKFRIRQLLHNIS